jgi:hypothetical protein
MAKLPEERRDKGRFGISVPCDFCEEGADADSGTTFDVSKEGMCIFSYRPLEVGHKINVTSKDLWDEPRTGIVQWCRRVKHNLYRIGILISDK